MLGRDLLMAHADRDGLRRLEEALGAVGKFLEVHGYPVSFERQMVLLICNTRVQQEEDGDRAGGFQPENACEGRSSNRHQSFAVPQPKQRRSATRCG
jgi:hypothetical protein